jgi:twitching motility protein PilJ
MTTKDRMEDLIDVIRAAQAGDLTVRAESTPATLAPLAQALNNMLEGLSQSVSQIAGDARATLSAAQGLSRALQAMTTGISRQQIAVAEIARRLRALEARSDEIGQIVELFDDVTAETNMLALNAAIEASRAGVQGKAFGLVAEDVRKLAERSTAATKDIGAFIQTIIASTNEANRSIDEISKLSQDLDTSAQEADKERASLTVSSNALMQMLAGLRFAGQDEADLTHALLEHKTQLASALAPLAPMLDRAPSALGDALRRVLAALDQGAENR